MWNCAKLGALGVSANKCADLDGVLIDGSRFGLIVVHYCGDNRYFTRPHSKSGTIAVASVAICRVSVLPLWLNAALHEAAYLSRLKWN
jgi:hypothetical protein